MHYGQLENSECVISKAGFYGLKERRCVDKCMTEWEKRDQSKNANQITTCPAGL